MSTLAERVLLALLWVGFVAWWLIGCTVVFFAVLYVWGWLERLGKKRGAPLGQRTRGRQ